MYELNIGENKPKLKKVKSSIIVYNYHYKDNPRMAYIFVITMRGFPDFMDSILKIEEEVESEMIKIRNKVE